MQATPPVTVCSFFHSNQYETRTSTDHYGGLSEQWSAGPIYCSPVTAALVQHLAGVRAEWLRPLPVGETSEVAGAWCFIVIVHLCHSIAAITDHSALQRKL